MSNINIILHKKNEKIFGNFKYCYDRPKMWLGDVITKVVNL